MLKAAIIYTQGSGGNLLARSLALSKQTIPYVPRELAEHQPVLQLSEQARFNYYNNWDCADWTTSEKSLRLWYHDGINDFVQYEKSPLDTIDQFHPAAFETETEQQVLWTMENNWEHIIFIKYKHFSLPNIIKLAELKRPDLEHRNQILTNELPAFDRLSSIYSGYTVYWEDMLIQSKYTEEISKLAKKLGLTLNLELVSQLWNTWKQQTDRLLST